jgi:hypothetical protein
MEISRMPKHRSDTVTTQLEEALLDHLRNVRVLSHWAEFAHDSSCSYFDESDDPFSFSRCNCGKAKLLEKLDLDNTESRLLGLIRALNPAQTS